MTITPTKELIIRNAADLFTKKGYTRSSLSQIAKATGCTAPALYYFFPGGKAELLRAVVAEFNVDPKEYLKEIQMANSLAELTELINIQLPKALQFVISNMNWIRTEISILTEEERNLVLDVPLSFYRFMNEEVSRFIKDLEEARKYTWFIFCAHVGFMEFFMWYQLDTFESYKLSELNNSLLKYCEKTQILECNLNS